MAQPPDKKLGKRKRASITEPQDQQVGPCLRAVSKVHPPGHSLPMPVSGWIKSNFATHPAATFNRNEINVQSIGRGSIGAPSSRSLEYLLAISSIPSSNFCC